VRKEILVLAKSWKTQGYCVAGVEVVRAADGKPRVGKDWLRPVTIAEDGKHHGCLPKHLCGDFRVFDIIDMELAHAETVCAQPENYLLRRPQIRKVASPSRLEAVGKVARNDACIWFDARTARDDQVSARVARCFTASGSLMLVQPENLTLSLELVNGSYGVRNRIHASFFYAGREYRRITVTEPAVFKVFRNQFPKEPGDRVEKRLRNGDGYWLTLSLSPEFNGNHYVLVAGVLDQTGYMNRVYG